MIARITAINLLLLFAFLSCKKDTTPELTLEDKLSGGESPSDLVGEYPLDSFYAQTYQDGYLSNEQRWKWNGSDYL